MNNRELLEQAAKAAGIEIYCWLGNMPMRSTGIGDYIAPWNPLTDDGDALRLAVKLGLEISCGNECRYPEEVTYYKTTSASYYDVVSGRDHECEESHNNDPYAATRLAIVRAAAEIGKAL